MAGKIKGITIEFDGNTTKLEQAIKKVKQSTSETDKALKAVNKSLKMDPSNVTLLEQKQKLLKDRVEETKTKLNDLRDAQNQLDAQGVDKNSKEYQELQREIIKAEQELKEFEKQTKMLANVKLTALGEQFKQVGGKMKEAGKGMTQYVTAPLAGVGAAAVKTTMDFDTGMSQVAATMGKTTGEIQDLRNFAIEMGSSTAFSATQAAEGLNYMALAGYDSEQSMKMLPTVLNLAAAGAMELGAASDMVTDAQTALGLSMGETTTMVDQMAKTSSTTNTSVSQLGEAILKIGPTAKSMSGGTRELNQVLGIMADNGIKGSEAGTHLRNILLSMNTDKVKDSFHELGVELYDTEGNLRDMSEVFPEMAAAMDGMTSEERTGMLSKLFNKTDLAALNSLLDTSTERWNEVGNAIDNAGGAAEQMADTQLDNLGGSLTLLKSALEGAGIALGDTLAPMVRKVADFITKLLEKFNSLSPTAKKVIAVVGLIVAAIGPLLVIGGTLISGIGQLMIYGPMIMGAVGGVASSFLPIVGIIAGVIAVGVLLYKNWDKIKAAAQALWDKIKAVFEGIKNTAVNVWNSIKTAISTTVNAIKTVIMTVFNAIKTFIISVMQAYANYVRMQWNLIKTIITTVINAIRTVVTTVFNAIKTVIQTVFNAIKTFISNSVNGWKTIISTAFNAIKSIASTVWNAIKTAIQTPINAAKNSVTNAIGAIKAIINGISGIIGNVKNAFNNIKNAMTSPISAAKEKISGIINKLKGFFPLSVGKIFSNIKLPHFRISGGQAPWGIGGKGTKPTIGIDWYARGGIFDDPTLIGVGEAGREILTPEKLLDEKLTASNANIEALLARMVAQNQIMIDELRKDKELKVDKRVAGRIVNELVTV